jgi:hypothetical protein
MGVPFIHVRMEREGDEMARAWRGAHGHARTARACMRGRRAQRGWAATGASVEATSKGVLFVRWHRVVS